ncbi:MAG: HAMP domain-containing histidine kinase [Acidobacteria bacterium]|nr:HAMP domain-containing histidine kinase [Acidobacteriota bacterium]
MTTATHIEDNFVLESPVLGAMWVSPARLADDWRPSYFDPIYDVIDHTLRTATPPLRRLGEFVKPYQSQEESAAAANPRWIVRIDQGRIRVKDAATSTPIVDLSGLQPLPDRAVLVSRLGLNKADCVYWGSDIYPGGGCVSPEVIVLTPAGGVDAAWLVSEMQNEFFRLQSRRAMQGSVVPRLMTERLLDLWVNEPSVEERQRLASAVRINQTAQLEQQEFVLTGATFEDRRRQFEEYLLRQPWVDRHAVFFVEASTQDRRADLFIVRPIGSPSGRRKSRQEVGLRPQNQPDAAKHWRDWYWNADNHWKIFNSLMGVDELPTFLLLRMLEWLSSHHPAQIVQSGLLPSFAVWRQIVEGRRDPEETLGPSAWDEIRSDWLEAANPKLGKSFPQQNDHLSSHSEDATTNNDSGKIVSWLRAVYRPALALKLVRDGQVAGAYIAFGADQADEPQKVRALLDGYGAVLSSAFYRSPEIINEAARLESLRRLSTVLHRLNGPIGRAASALDDIQQFLQERGDIAAELLPNPEAARRRAAMNKGAESENSLAARVGVIQRAIDEIRKTSDQINKLRRVQGNLERSAIDIAGLAYKRAQACRDQIPELEVDLSECQDSILVWANEESLVKAIDEVLVNACRELKARNTRSSLLRVRMIANGEDVRIEISDNGLPADCDLIAHPFEEEASAYFGSGQGTGLGLTIVREVFQAHGGRCDLRPNYDGQGSRLDGVTFEAVLPIYKEPEE